VNRLLYRDRRLRLVWKLNAIHSFPLSDKIATASNGSLDLKGIVAQLVHNLSNGLDFLFYLFAVEDLLLDLLFAGLKSQIALVQLVPFRVQARHRNHQRH